MANERWGSLTQNRRRWLWEDPERAISTEEMLSSRIWRPLLKRFASPAACIVAAFAFASVTLAGQFATEKNLPFQLKVVFPRSV